MKKFISIMLCVCICLFSTVFCFADFTSTDSTTLSNIYKYMPTSSQVTTITNTLSTINSRVLNIYNALFSGNHSIGYWVEAINSWMQPIYGKLSDILTQSLNIEAVAGLLGSTDVVDGTTVRTPYLSYNGKGAAQWISELVVALTNSRDSSNGYKYWAHSQLVESDGRYQISLANSDGQTNPRYIGWYNGSPLGNIALLQAEDIKNNTLIYRYNWNGIWRYSNNQQSFVDWTTLESNNFTPRSMGEGIYTWLSKIQNPVARLSYVLASDERIEAQEKAAENEQAVVDNFIDSSGSGAASTSDFGNVSNLSSGFKNNISTDASVSGIWNIFNSDNFGWFSQETANQLDTTASGNRTLRNSSSYPTPLLDQQTEDILKYIGGDNND